MTPASGTPARMRCRRVRANRVIKKQSSMTTITGTIRGHKMVGRFKSIGGTELRAVVDTVTVADWLAISELWLREQVVACAGEVQETATCPVNPFRALTVTTFVNVAVWPAVTVCEPCPAATVKEKSGGPVTMKLKGAEVPAGGESTT